MMNHRTFGLALLIAAAVAPIDAAWGRLWTDASGKYSVEADLIAFSDETVILQRADHNLGEIARDKLSEDDRAFLDAQQAAQSTDEFLGATQTWTSQRGLKIEGRVVDYFEQSITLQRRRGKLYVESRRFDNLPEIYQRIIQRVVEHADGVTIDKQTDLNRWVAKQKGKPREFSGSGVILELANGDEYAVPFFLFSDDDRRVLRAGYDEWQSENAEYESRADDAFRLQALAAAYQRDQQANRQVAQMQLMMQAVSAGVTSLWEVTLYPGRGMQGQPIWVVMPGRDSRAATAAALANNPGYVAGPVRKVSW